MKTTKRGAELEKAPTGVEGLDQMTAGGFPKGRTTLLLGGPGCGKTVLALQALMHGARQRVPGVFVCFEEDPARMVANAESFGWNPGGLRKGAFCCIDARINPGTVMTGAFDLTALLAGVEAKARQTGAKTVVFDAIDVLLDVLNDPAAERRELYRIQQWLATTSLTGIFTAKLDEGGGPSAERCSFLQFLADCTLLLRQQVVGRAVVRDIRVVKYRGSGHVQNATPFVIASTGVEVGSSADLRVEPQRFQERVASGLPRLDEMLNGGVYRGTNALVTGSAGTGKSTLGGLFVEAACRRGERALFVSFDEYAQDVARDLASIGVQLAPHLKSGLLRMEAFRTESVGAEEHFFRIKRLVSEHQPACAVIDPVSSLVRAGGEVAARSITERLIYLFRQHRLTTVFTSLTEGRDEALETTPVHISTLADSWIQLSYALRGGERNRALTIIKSRGSKHSNQLRELVFSDTGVTLTDPYTAGGKVLMGTLRIEKESAVRTKRERKRLEIEQKRREVELALADRDLRLEAAQRDLTERADELEILQRAETATAEGSQQRSDEVVRKRDHALVAAQKPPPNGRSARKSTAAKRKRAT